MTDKLVIEACGRRLAETRGKIAGDTDKYKVTKRVIAVTYIILALRPASVL